MRAGQPRFRCGQLRSAPNPSPWCAFIAMQSTGYSYSARHELTVHAVESLKVCTERLNQGGFEQETAPLSYSWAAPQPSTEPIVDLQHCYCLRVISRYADYTESEAVLPIT